MMTGSAVRPRECYGEVTTYSSDVDRCAIDLSDNTNLWGCPPSALRAIESLTPDRISRYPQTYSASLREKLAEYLGVDVPMIVTGCGSDDIIDSALRAFGEPDDVVRCIDPTFSMIPYFSRTNGLRASGIAPAKLFEPTPAQMLEGDPGIVYICSPNNPTGTTVTRAFVEKVVSGARGIVIIDEAYVDFGGESALDLVGSGRVLVTRTMSKAFGLAGLRIGYGIGSPTIVAAVEKARGPYKVGVAAECAAVAVLAEDGDWIQRRIADVKKLRARFTSQLESLGYAPIHSSANFILLPVSDCAAVGRKLRESGIAVRAFPDLAGIGDAIRISIGPWEMMRPCLAALGGMK